MPDFALNPGRRERNFWMQRRDAKIGLRDRKSVSRDGKSGTIPTKIPTETAYSEAALGFAVWVGLGGGRDRDRTCDPYHVKVVLFR